MSKKRTLLIDADTLVFAAASANEYEAQWNDWLWTLHGDFETAKEALKDSLDQIQEELQPTRMILALSDQANWRKQVMPSYKEHRKKTRKPVVYLPLRQWVHECYETFQRPALEGDDVLGILATDPDILSGERIIVSIDKDMKTIPGLHLNYSHARQQQDWSIIREVTEPEADRFHLFQTLTGDSTDGYPGCPSVGPVGAEKILGDDPTWEKVVAAYAKQGLGVGVALQNAQVARICRYTEYDFEKKEVVPWQPSKAAA